MVVWSKLYTQLNYDTHLIKLGYRGSNTDSTIRSRNVTGRLAECPLRVNRVGVTVGEQLLVYPDQRTSTDRLNWSVSCQQQTHAPRGKSRPMDQSVDADEHGSFGQPRLPKTLSHQLRV
jgi:hypothetical protein